MRFIRRCLMAASYALVFLGSAQAQSVTIGQTTVLSAPDGGNGNLLAAQSANLAQAATIQSLSFYVTAAAGNLILGIYDATGPNGGPGALKARPTASPQRRLEYGQGRYACLIGRRRLLVGLSDESDNLGS